MTPTFAIILAATVAAVLLVAWCLGQSLIRIEDYAAEQQPPVVPPQLPPAPHVPDVERHIDWVLPPDDEFEQHLAELREQYAANLRAWRWATGELDKILVDARDVISGYASDLYDLELYPGWDRHTMLSGTGQGEGWGNRTEVLWCNRPLGVQPRLEWEMAS